MDAGLLGRQALLAAVAVLASLGVLALGRAGEAGDAPAEMPEPVSTAWEEAVASTFPEDAYGQETTCGIELTHETRGVAHPVLPCGVAVVVSFGGRSARTEVIEQGPFESGREFDLTEALARELGFSGTETIRWRFADRAEALR